MMGQALAPRLSQGYPCRPFRNVHANGGVAEHHCSRGRQGRIEVLACGRQACEEKPSGLSQTRDTPLSPAERARGAKP
jgi:hypothetical protein